mmetsp:Transcript_29558/g.28754  ORF Transcript_29558/g.28754 Transcript_29558/m.28754 type:complete len:212 (-) Transcript_29558:664-1299(-)
MYILEVSLSFLSLRWMSSSMVTAWEIFLMRLELRQFMSMGSRTTSEMLDLMNYTHSCTNCCIPRKSELINMEITFFKSSLGSLLSFKYFMSHSKILMSQWTEMSMSSKDYASYKYYSKYFICERRRFFSHLKSLLTFLFSSKTWMTISSSEGLTMPICLRGCPGLICLPFMVEVGLKWSPLPINLESFLDGLLSVVKWLELLLCGMSQPPL